MRTDSTTLFKQARIEFKNAEAFVEAASSALREREEILTKAETTYLEALSLGVPAYIAGHVARQQESEAERAYLEAEECTSRAQKHRDKGRKLMDQRDKQYRKELRVRFSG